MSVAPTGSEGLEAAFIRQFGEQKCVAWFRRMARARGRLVIAQSQLRRLTAMEAGGREVNTAAIHEVEQELSDAAQAMEFCRQVIKHAGGK